MYLIPHFVLLVFFFFLEIILEQKSNRKCSLVEINKISDFLRTYFFYLLCMCVVLCIVCVYVFEKKAFLMSITQPIAHPLRSALPSSHIFSSHQIRSDIYASFHFNHN